MGPAGRRRPRRVDAHPVDLFFAIDAPYYLTWWPAPWAAYERTNASYAVGPPPSIDVEQICAAELALGLRGLFTFRTSGKRHRAQ